MEFLAWMARWLVMPLTEVSDTGGSISSGDDGFCLEHVELEKPESKKMVVVMGLDKSLSKDYPEAGF